MWNSLVAALCLLSISPVRPDDELGEYGGGDPYGGGYGGDPYGMGGGYGGYGGDPYGGYGGYGGGYGDEYGGDPTPPFTLLEDIESVQKFLNDEDTEPAVIGFFNEEAHQSDIEAFVSVAAANRYEMRFAYSIEDDVRAAYSKKSTGMRVDVFKPPRFVSDKYDKPKARYPGKYIDEGALTKFFQKSALPLVGQKTWKSNERYESSGLPVVTVFTDVDLEKNSKGFDYYANRVRKVAVDFKTQLVFNIGDKSDFEYLLDDYDLELPDKKDVGVGIKFNDHYYHMTESFSVDNLRNFVESYLKGELTAKVKETPSEPPSHDDDEDEDDGSPSSVVTLTNDNFEEVVMAEGTDVMVEFYAPWCGHCMQLKPTYKKLAAAFDNVPSVTVAAMDATEHDVPEGFDVQGYPTVLFLPNGAKDKPMSYDGARELNSMVSFIKANAAVPINDEL